MKQTPSARALPILILILTWFCSPTAAIEVSSSSSKDISLQNETKHAISKAITWLQSKQNPKGYWTSAENPALTALALMAFMGEPEGKIHSNPPDFVKKGYTYLKSCVQQDGGIYQKELSNYNTSLTVTAFVLANNPEYDLIIKKARMFIIGQQGDFGEKGKQDNPFDGGVGYGDDGPHSDMSNTLFALEALYYSKSKKTDIAEIKGEDLNWDAAVQFLQRCQNLPEYNKQPWASDDPENKGGFVYSPEESKAESVTLRSGKIALRSYGSMSYAGLLSYIYADLKKDDPRVVAVYNWLLKNYSLDENPGMGQQGLYYYFQTMAKALSKYGVEDLKFANGKTIRWRKELALKLINLQKNEGFWVNENGRFWEKDPVLVTSYAIITLDLICPGL